jgi:hypothetical protein
MGRSGRKRKRIGLFNDHSAGLGRPVENRGHHAARARRLCGGGGLVGIDFADTVGFIERLVNYVADAPLRRGAAF